MAHIYRKPNGHYCAVVQVAGIRAKLTAPTKREVEQLAAAKTIELGGNTARSDATMRELVDLWRLQPSQKRDGNKAGHFLDDVAGLFDADPPRIPDEFMDRRVSTIDAEVIDYLYASLMNAAQAKREDRVPLSAWRVQRVHTVLKAAWNLGIARKKAPHDNPFEVVHPPRATAKARRRPTDADLRRILEAIAGSDFETYLELSIVVGARRGEVVALQWPDLRANSLAITKSWSYSKRDGLVLVNTKTDAKGHRVVAIPANLTARLRAMQTRQCRDATAAGLPEPLWIFSHDAGATAWLPGYPTLRFTRLRERLGVEVVMKNLRQYMITTLQAEGVPTSVVQLRAGHSTSSTTREWYTDYVPAADQGAADAMAAVVARIRGGGAGAGDIESAVAEFRDYLTRANPEDFNDR